MIRSNAGDDEYLLWDQHGCLPLRPSTDVRELQLYSDAGVDLVSVNVGFDSVPWQQSLEVLLSFRRQVLDLPDRMVLVCHAADVTTAQQQGLLAVVFDLEGTEALDGRVELIETYYSLGVRTMLIAYNLPNRAGGGCHGDTETGLTPLGREIVAEMNRVGMVVDATHCGFRTTMDLFEASTKPVIFSHSVPRSIKDHPRNISDEQMRACAATGGVIGINGVGVFLGDNTARTHDLFRAVDYAVSLVGPEHVGIGLDYVFDQDELNQFINENPETFPSSEGYSTSMAFVEPRQVQELADLMVENGYPSGDVRAILGENFLRVAKQTWA